MPSEKVKKKKYYFFFLQTSHVWNEKKISIQFVAFQSILHFRTINSKHECVRILRIHTTLITIPNTCGSVTVPKKRVIQCRHGIQCAKMKWKKKMTEEIEFLAGLAIRSKPFQCKFLSRTKPRFLAISTTHHTIETVSRLLFMLWVDHQK